MWMVASGFWMPGPSTDRASALLSDLLMRALNSSASVLALLICSEKCFWLLGADGWVYLLIVTGLKLLDAFWGRLCRQIFNLLYMLLSPCFSKWKEHTNKASSAFRRGVSTHVDVEWSTNEYHEGGNTITGNTCFCCAVAHQNVLQSSNMYCTEPYRTHRKEASTNISQHIAAASRPDTPTARSCRPKPTVCDNMVGLCWFYMRHVHACPVSIE